MNTVVLNEGRHAAEFVLSELPGHQSRGNCVIAPNQLVLVGSILAQVVRGAPESVVVTKGAYTGVGNGTLTLNVAGAYDANTIKAGTYRVQCVEVVHEGGEFVVLDPDTGDAIGEATEGSPFATQIKFQIDADTTPVTGVDFALGDEWLIEVAITPASIEGTYALWAPGAMDGTEVAAAIALYPVDTTVLGPQQPANPGNLPMIAAIVRGSEVNGHVLSWPTGVTLDQINAAAVALLAVGILVR